MLWMFNWWSYKSIKTNWCKIINIKPELKSSLSTFKGKAENAASELTAASFNSSK